MQTYSGYHVNRLSMSNLLEFGAMVDRRQALKQSCAFIHNEGPIRLAHMIQVREAGAGADISTALPNVFPPRK